MHACGHDLHMAALVGLARAMQALRGRWRGRLVLVGQPSEERVSGAAAMLADGLYDRVGRPDWAIALHVAPEHPEGTVLFTEGTASAGAESIDLLVRGLGGHAAHPDQTRDPVLLAAACVLGFQGIVSRELDPQSFGVLTVSMIHGGVKHNAIPDEVRLGLNIRFFDDAVRARLLDGIERVVTGLARAAGVSGGPDACPHAPRRVRPAARERPDPGPPGPRRGRGRARAGARRLARPVVGLRGLRRVRHGRPAGPALLLPGRERERPAPLPDLRPGP